MDPLREGLFLFCPSLGCLATDLRGNLFARGTDVVQAGGELGIPGEDAVFLQEGRGTDVVQAGGELGIPGLLFDERVWLVLLQRVLLQRVLCQRGQKLGKPLGELAFKLSLGIGAVHFHRGKTCSNSEDTITDR